ncbi:G5 domain-containing protein [Gemella haemolysans]|uniref:G5 domain-containing protein n=1 Tax=Gemella haemolysans TaxID=1379 RepID=UPI00290E8429|nr:G5 domain-containing protein [Gemella haemolysans]MDU3832362.1 G5 domain-containing protein [Gemella haemolysans]
MNKKFSIRKLAIGTVSVAIGLSTTGTINSASAVDNNSSEIVGNVSNSETSGSTLDQSKEEALTEMILQSQKKYPFWEDYRKDFEFNWRNPIKKAKTKEEISSILKSFYVKVLRLSEIEAEKKKAILEIQKYNHSEYGAETTLVSEYKSRINNAQTKNEIDTILQNFKAQLPNELNLFISNLKNLTQDDLKELNLTIESNKQMRNKAIILNELHKIKDLDKEIFDKFKTEIITSTYIGDVEREIAGFIPRVEIEQARKKLTKRVYDAEFLSNSLKSKIINYANEISDIVNINVLSYSFDTLEKLSKNTDISESKKEALMTELIKAFDYNSGDFNTDNRIKVYHLLSVIRSLNEQYEIKNNINNESKLEESKTIPEYELSLSNKKVIAYDFLKGLTYPTLEKLRADIINSTEEDIYSLSHKASAIKQINSIKALNSNDKERYINEILEADLRSDLSSIVGKVLENDIIETSNLSDKHKNRLKEILNSLPQTNYNTFSDIISSALAINESKDLSSEEKEAFFDEFINKYKSPINQDTPSLDYETLYKMDVSILINKLSYLTDEDKKLYKEKIFAQKPALGSAGVGELEYKVGFFTKDKILKNSEYTLESIKEFDAYKEAVAKNEELRKKKENEPTFDSKTENADIPFETIYKDDNTLDKGTEVTETEGTNGVKEITTTYTVINGVRQDNPKVEEKVTKEKIDKVVRRGTKVTSSETEKSTQSIPFETIYKDDNTLDKGKEVVITEGINGTKEITTTYTVINGVRQDNPKVEEKITKEKVDKVVRRGTKVSTTTTPELTTNTNKPISSSTSNNKPSTATPTNKPVNSSANDSKPNTVTPTDKPVNSSANNSKPNTVTPTDKPVNSSANDSKPSTVTPTDKPAVNNSKSTLANITLENTNNDISVTLATAETGVKLVTDEVTNPTTLNEVKEKITNENNSITSTTDITNLRVVDLTLEKEGKKYSTNANRTVRIALLNNEKGNEILVYHVKDNGELEELTKEKNNLTITNDNVEFTINHFSKFAIASIKKNIPTPSTNTSEEHNKNKDNRKDLTDIKPSESNQNKILPRTGVSSSSTVLLGATLLSLALISRKLKKN